MNILVTGANGQLGNEMRIVSKNTSDNYIFTDVNQEKVLKLPILILLILMPFERW